MGRGELPAVGDTPAMPTGDEKPVEVAPGEAGSPGESVAGGPSPVGSLRRQHVELAAKAWTGQLIDLGGRNNLLYYRDLRRGTLELTEADPKAFGDLLAGKVVPLSRLFREDALEDALPRARTVRNKAREHFEERGLETLFLACGMATWQSSASASTPAAPVLLQGLALSPRGAAQEDFDLSLTGEAEINPTLLHLLETEFKCAVDLEGLMGRMDGAIDTPDELTEAYRWLEEEAAGIPGFTVAPRLVVGTFSYAKLPMVKDLEGSLDALLAHPLIAALAGDEEARNEIRAQNGAGVVNISEPDRTAPGDEFLILDADSSQNYAINAVLAGRNLIVRGPPGTGKSQTIANLIATLVARGKRVLFVAEKRAAIDAVLGRVERVGLRDLVLDLHGTETRRQIAQSLAATLHRAGRTPAVLRDVEDRILVRRRDELANYAAALHAPREPWGITVFEAQAQCIGTPERASSGVRLHGDTLVGLGGAEYREALEDLRDYVGRGGLRLARGASPWAAAVVTTPQDAARAFELVVRLHQETLPAFRSSMDVAARAAGHASPATLEQLPDRLSLYEDVAVTLGILKPEAFGEDAGAILPDAEALGRGGLSRVFAGLSGTFRAARRKLEQLAIVPETAPDRLYAALQEAQAQRKTWELVPRCEGLAVPDDVCVAPELSTLRERYTRLNSEVSELTDLLPRLGGAAGMSPDELSTALEELRADQPTLTKLPELRRLEAALTDRGLGELVEDCARVDRGVDESLASLRFVWSASVIEHVALADPSLGTFDASQHQRTADEFRQADVEHVESTAARVGRRSAEEIIRARDEWPDESAVLEKQAALKRRHLPLRHLFQAAPNVLLALKPCWAMSPLMVSQVLPSEQPYFDVVVFDEASQVMPADATPAILRGRQLVVSGDEKQLPPTSFFAAQTREEEEADPDALLSGTGGFESILDALTPYLPPRTLEWHYRSQDERLIAFSNVHLYERMLTTFPGVGGEENVVQHVLVPHRPGQVGSDESGADEVRRVVELMLDHARRRPQETLGVIAMGIKHAERIDEQLRRALLEHPELDGFFADGHAERPFIKNLERVQGDERDAIILTIGYGKSPDGRMLYRFGPLNQEGGERRLNVAVTRARKRLTLVSSFVAGDMDPDRTKARGVELLRLYLAYAESAGRNLGESVEASPTLNPFEVDVKGQLEAAGIGVDAQVGCSGYRIDFAARHPGQPGRHILAIECDGASYHSSATARDRDRLRQGHLERLGWKFHRIWSPEWFHRREQALAKAVDAYRLAVEAADEADRRALEGEGLSAESAPPETGASPVADCSAPERGPRPPWIRSGQPIDAYSSAQLIALIRWIGSDTLLRTEEQIIQEAAAALGYQRRGSRIVAALQQAVASANGRRTGG